MAAIFTPISSADLDAWIATARRAPEELQLERCRERVLFWPVAGREIGVAVFTSVLRGRGESRDVGEDAIRVTVFDRATGRMLAGSRRIHRTQNWQDRLSARVAEVYHRARAWRNCAACGKPMAEREGKHGTFMGCSGYPECRKTMPIAEAHA